jgi:hypothetical protein
MKRPSTKKNKLEDMLLAGRLGLNPPLTATLFVEGKTKWNMM